MVQYYFGLGLYLVFVFAETCVGQQRGGVDRETAKPLIVSILSKAGVSGSMEYWGTCKNKSGVPDYPRLEPHRDDASTPVEALREMFADDTEMQVSQDIDGTIRMREADVPRDFLDVTISHISFDGRTRKIRSSSDEPWRTEPAIVQDPNDALQIILATPEVQAFMKSRNIKWPYPYESASSPNWPSKPQISGNLDGVTVRQALDYVLKVYPGYWVYENCYNESKERLVYFRFTFDSLGWAARVKGH